MLLVAAAAVLFKQLLGAVADRGSRHHRRHRHRAGGLDGRLHRPVRAHRGRSSARRPFVERFFTVDRLLGRDPGDQLRPAGRLGPAHRSSSRTSPRACSPSCSRSRACSPSPPTRLRSGQSPIDKPVQFVLQTSQPYEVLQEAVDQMMAGARRTRACRTRQRPEAQQAAAQGQDRPREGGADGDRRRRRSAARSRPCWAGGRSPASSARASSTTSWSSSRTSDRTTPTICARSSSAASDGGMVPLSNLVAIEETVAPKELNHFNKLRSATLPRPWRPATRWARRCLPRGRGAAKLPPGIVTDLNGQSREFRSLDQRALRHLPPGAGLHLPGARGPVRELDRPVRHHADGAAVDDRRAAWR